MARFGLCGPSYASQSPTADAEDLFGWYVETMEASAKSQLTLYPTPGLAVFSNPGGAAVRGSLYFVPPGSIGRYFAIIDGTLWEVLAGGGSTNRGGVANDGLPASLAYNQGNQVLIASGGSVYVFNLGTNVLAAIPGMLGAISQVAFCDGYFIALLANSNKLQISALLDGTNWPGLQVIVPSIFADGLQGMIVDHRELWLWSGTHGAGYYNSGSSSIFDPIGASSLCEDGLNAPSSLVKADNTFFWINANERGDGQAKRLNGNTPVRISNHALEYQWSRYATIADAVGYSYEDQGHTFIVYSFPTANATWVYDTATGLWHRRGFWDVNLAQYSMHRSSCHSFAFGQHLVGDPRSGTIYSMSINNLDDFGNAIRRMRISPPISHENEWMFHHKLQVDAEAGLGSQVGQGADPQISLSWSDDGGHTWSNEYMTSAGKVGQYTKRMLWRRLGRSRQRYYRIVATDPIPWRIIEGDLTATPGFDPSPRLPKQYQKVS